MKVTKSMLDAAELAHHEYWCGENPDHSTLECEGGISRRLLRNVLQAALEAVPAANN